MKEKCKMKKLLFLCVIGLVFTVGGCSQPLSEKSSTPKEYTEKQTEVEETNTSTNSFETKSESANKTSVQQEEVNKLYSTTVAVSNAVIVEDNHENNVVYKKKCDSCGYVESGTHVISPGSITSSIYCPNCQETKKVELKTSYSD